MNNHIKQIARFNADKNVLRLKGKYNETSFFEIIAKQRTETTYSAFLKWLLEGNAASSEGLSPLQMLLDILVKRIEEDPTIKAAIPAELKDSIVTRSLSIHGISADVEKPVASLAREIAEGNDVCSSGDMMKIAAKSADCVDIFLQCEVSAKGLKTRPMQFFIENKPDFCEEKIKYVLGTGVEAYDNASRTERYYMATRRDDMYQWYVCLTPQPVIPKRHYSKENEPEDPHFIHMTYQDILDGIIVPLLASSSLSSRTRFFLEEFRNQLTFPSQSGASVLPGIAIGNDRSEELTPVWKEYEDLITDAALAASERTFWKINDKWYDQQPRLDLALALQEVGEPKAKDFLTRDDEGRLTVVEGVRYKDMTDLAQKNGIMTEIADKDFGDSRELLSAFWDRNKRFLTALLCGIEDKENVFALVQELSKRDSTKYMVYYDGKPLVSKPATGGITAWVIVALWCKLYVQSGTTPGIEDLRKAFPRTFNPYYEQGKWFKNLFYPKSACVYDGENGDGSEVTSHWDIDLSGKYDFATVDGPVVFLKKWRKPDLEHFVDKALEMPIFGGKLNVVPE